MSEHFHLITPISRPQHIAGIAEYVYKAFEDPDATYTWWWIQFPDEELSNGCQEILEGNPNIRMMTCERIPEWHDIMTLFNAVLSKMFEEGQPGWVWHVQDDNIVSPWAIEKWCKAIHDNPDKGVIVCNHDRGDHSTRHGSSPLMAAPCNMNVGGVSLEQYLIRLDLHKGVLYINSACGDGIIMRDMYADMPQEFAFIQDFYVPFNALEPGRWEPPHLAWFSDWTETNPRKNTTEPAQ